MGGGNMPTPYKNLYDGVLAKIKDYDLATLSEDEVYEILFDYIRPAIVQFKYCKQDLSDRDDVSQTFNITLAENEIEILILFMIVEYLDSNYIRVPDALKNTLSSKDFNAFSGANQLDKVRATRSMYYEEVKQLMRDYSYINSNLFNIK